MSAKLVVVEEDGREYTVTAVTTISGEVLIYTADALYVSEQYTGNLFNSARRVSLRRDMRDDGLRRVYYDKSGD